MLKEVVAAHWESEPCETRGLEPGDRAAFFAELSRRRRATQPYIARFARFDRARGCRVLEVGVGAGTDFVEWARVTASATGVDLTRAAATLTRERLRLEGLPGVAMVADAERLPFRDESFDIVYSYGVLHHTPDTEQSIREVHRVLAPGGTALLMLYHHPSWTALLLWLRHGLLRGRPWRSPRWALASYLESPGTKAYTHGEARRLLSAFPDVTMTTEATPMFSGQASEKYRSAFDRLAFAAGRRLLAPVINRFGRRWGLALLIEARKGAGGQRSTGEHGESEIGPAKVKVSA